MSGPKVHGLDRVAADRRAVIAAQVRCSTGYTQGRLRDGEAVVPPLRRAAVPMVAPAAVPGAVVASRLLALLCALDADAALPRVAEWFGALGIADSAGPSAAVAAAFEALAAQGAIEMVAGTRDVFPGARVVRVLVTGRRHATQGAPAHWLGMGGGR